MRTISKDDLRTLKKNSEELRRRLDCTTPEDAWRSYQETLSFLRKADQAGVVSKGLMTKSGSWIGDVAHIDAHGLAIERDKRFTHKQGVKRTQVYALPQVREMLYGVLGHVIRNACRIEHKNGSMLQNHWMTTDPYGEYTVKGKGERKGAHIRWQPAVLEGSELARDIA